MDVRPKLYNFQSTSVPNPLKGPEHPMKPETTVQLKQRDRNEKGISLTCTTADANGHTERSAVISAGSAETTHMQVCTPRC